MEQGLARVPDRSLDVLSPAEHWPLELVDLFGIELPLLERRSASLHLRLVPTTLRSIEVEVLAEADRLMRLRSALVSGLVGKEFGVVLDPTADGTLGCDTLYARVPSGASPEQVEALRQTLGGPIRCAASRRLVAHATYVGVMPARPGHPVRYVIVVPQGQDAVDVLREVGLSESTVRQAAAALDGFPAVGRRYLNVDVVDGAIGPVVGIEHKPAAGDEQDRTDVLLRWLANQTAVRIEDAEAIRAWAGRRLLAADGQAATAADAADLLAGGAGFVEHRRVNHVKVTVGLRREVKVYLSCARRSAHAVPSP